MPLQEWAGLTVVVTRVVVEVPVGTRQLHALEILSGRLEQYVAKAGRLVVAVWEVRVYVLQNDAAATEEAVRTEAQGSVSGLVHARARGAKAARRKMECILDLGSVKGDWQSMKPRRMMQSERGQVQAKTLGFIYKKNLVIC